MGRQRQNLRILRFIQGMERLHPHRLGQPPVYRRFNAGNQIVEYHGDILLYGPARGKDSAEMVARFTHGRLEWIRPVDEYPDINYMFLLEHGAR